MAKSHALTHENVETMDMYFYNCHIDFSRILTEMSKIIFDLYMGLSLVNYGTTHGNYILN